MDCQQHHKAGLESLFTQMYTNLSRSSTLYMLVGAQYMLSNIKPDWPWMALDTGSIEMIQQIRSHYGQIKPTGCHK